MSVYVSTNVWEFCTQKGDRLLLMLALANHCSDEGYCWPSQLTLSRRIRCTERGVQKMIDALIKEEEIVLIRAGICRGKSAQYWLPLYKRKGERGAERANVETGKDEQAVPPNHKEPSIEPSVITCVLPNPKKKKGKSEVEDDEFIQKLKDNYPNLNMEVELQNAKGWILAHPPRQFNRRFVTNWMSTANLRSAELKINGNHHAEKSPTDRMYFST